MVALDGFLTLHNPLIEIITIVKRIGIVIVNETKGFFLSLFDFLCVGDLLTELELVLEAPEQLNTTQHLLTSPVSKLHDLLF